MVTKFTKLVNLRKNALKEGERKVIGINQKIAATQIELDHAQQQLAEIIIPTHGKDFSEVIRFQSIKESHLHEIDNLVQLIAAFRLEKKVAEEELRILNMEYEKANYLDSLEKKKILEEFKRKETAALDEISVMLYNSRTHHEGDTL